MLAFEEPKNKKHLKSNIWQQQVRPYHPTSIGGKAVNLHVCPGRKWIDEYLQKEDTVEIIASVLPQEELGHEPIYAFFPTQEQQESLMAAKDKVLDMFYANHKKTHKDWLHERTFVSATATAHEYFKYRMFVTKDMRVIANSRRVHQINCAMLAYATESQKLTALELQQHRKENG